MPNSTDQVPLCEPEGLILFHSTPRSHLSRLTEVGAVKVELHGRVPPTDQNCVLAVQASALDSLRLIAPDLWHADHVPCNAFLNIDPYCEPNEIVAAGGLVLRTGTDLMELLLIHRNGVWDLPKGKQDANETLEVCARREVEEETGASLLQTGPLIVTYMHGYERNNTYHVKTTYWYAFQSSSTALVPQSGEGITRVAWVPWQDAEAGLGYAGLRNMLGRVRPVMDRWSATRRSRA